MFNPVYTIVIMGFLWRIGLGRYLHQVMYVFVVIGEILIVL